MSAFCGKKDNAVSWQKHCIDKAKTMQCLFIEDILYFQSRYTATANAVYLHWQLQYI